MSEERRPGRVEDFTGAFLVSFGVLLFTGLMAVWAWFGLAGAIIVTVVCDRLFRLIRRA